MKENCGRGGGIVLIHPPMAKGCEAPGGVARLAGALRGRGVECRIWDANIEGQLALLAAVARERADDPSAGLREGTGQENRELSPFSGDGPHAWGRAGRGEKKGAVPFFPDRWTKRAARHLEENLASLRSGALYGSPDRYRRAVTDLNRLLTIAARPWGVRLSLADYEDERLSPVRSADLLQAAAEPGLNPFHPWFSRRLPEILAAGPVSHVGFSLNYLSQALTTFAMIGFVRQAFPAVRIVLGGGLVTSWIRQPSWKNPFAGIVEAMIDGPGEAPLLALLGSSHDGAPGRPDLAGFPLADYLAPGVILPYSASNGCWWRRCSFCPEKAEKNPYRPLSPARVSAELHALVRDWKPALIHLLDNALSPALLSSLAADPPGAPWYGFARVEKRLADPAFCRRLRDSGCAMLKLGLESGDQEVLDALGKGIDLPTASAALTNLKAAGIGTYVYLLFGTPAESPGAAARTLAFTADHADRIDFLNLALFNLPAWGPDTDRLETGHFYEGDLSLYRPFVHPLGWGRGEVRRFLEGTFKRHPAIAAILRAAPPFFGSNHAPFFHVKP